MAFEYRNGRLVWVDEESYDPAGGDPSRAFTPESPLGIAETYINAAQPQNMARLAAEYWSDPNTLGRRVLSGVGPLLSGLTEDPSVRASRQGRKPPQQPGTSPEEPSAGQQVEARNEERGAAAGPDFAEELFSLDAATRGRPEPEPTGHIRYNLGEGWREMAPGTGRRPASAPAIRAERPVSETDLRMVDFSNVPLVAREGDRALPGYQPSSGPIGPAADIEAMGPAQRLAGGYQGYELDEAALAAEIAEREMLARDPLARERAKAEFGYGRDLALLGAREEMMRGRKPAEESRKQAIASEAVGLHAAIMADAKERGVDPYEDPQTRRDLADLRARLEAAGLDADSLLLGL